MKRFFVNCGFNGSQSTIEADEAEIVGPGHLMFKNMGGEIVGAFAPGHWTNFGVVRDPDNQAGTPNEWMKPDA